MVLEQNLNNLILISSNCKLFFERSNNNFFRILNFKHDRYTLRTYDQSFLSDFEAEIKRYIYIALAGVAVVVHILALGIRKWRYNYHSKKQGSGKLCV